MMTDLPAILKMERNDLGKEVRKRYEKHQVKIRRCDMKHLTVREDGLTNSLTTVQKDNLLLVEK